MTQVLPVIHHKVDFTAVWLVPGPLSTTVSVGPGGMDGLGWAHQVGSWRLVTSNRPQGFPGSFSKVPQFWSRAAQHFDGRAS